MLERTADGSQLAVDGAGVTGDEVVERGDVHHVELDAGVALVSDGGEHLSDQRGLPIPPRTVDEHVVAAVQRIADVAHDPRAVEEFAASDAHAIAKRVLHAG